jgi:predicted DNA-binding transcriptional regulator YafY
MPDYTPAQRLERVRALLWERRAGATRAELAAQFDVNERTVRRYVEELQRRGDTIHEERQGDGRFLYRLERPAPVTEVFQYAALYTATRHLHAIDDEVLGAPARALVEGLAEGVPEDMARRVRRAFYYHPFGPKHYGLQEDNVQRVVHAAIHRRKIDLTYHYPSPEKAPKRFRFSPWCVVLYRDGLYVYGARDNREERILALDRVREVAALTDAFAPPADFDPEEKFLDWFGIFDNQDPVEVRLRFRADAVAIFNERRWPGLLSLDEAPGGGLEARLRVNPHAEFENWVLGWGPRVELLSPAWLRAVIVARLREAAAQYDDAPP